MSRLWKTFLNFPTRNMSTVPGFSSKVKPKDRGYIKITENEEKRTAIVSMQKLPVNSFNLQLLEELHSAIKMLEENKYRGLILTSSSPTIFSAGLDITELMNTDANRLKKFWTALQEMWKTLYISPLVTIAAINGHAPAGGCLLAMACDHSIMVDVDSYKIGLPATKLGIHVPKWLCAMYVQAIGFRRADHATKLGESFSPREALNLNLVDELADSPADLIPKAERKLDEWLKIPEGSFYRTKLNFRQSLVNDMTSYAEDELDEVVRVTLMDETQESLATYYNQLKIKE